MLGFDVLSRRIGAVALLAGLTAAAVYGQAGLTLAHYDARAHLVVARRVLDSITPGWQQIGAVWLPVPHVLNMLPVQIDLFYRTGASAIAFSVLALGDMNFSYSRLLAFGAALAGMIAVYFFMTRTFTGTAIRAIAQDRQIMSLMGVDAKRIYLVTSAIGGGMAGVAAALLALQYDVHPAIGLSFGPITFMICVLGGLGNMAGGFIAAFVFAQLISVGGFYFQVEWGYVIAFAFFIVMMFIKPQGLFSR